MSLLILTGKFLANNGYVRNIWCGITSTAVWCKVCQQYNTHVPMQREGTLDFKYVCNECKTYSEWVN